MAGRCLIVANQTLGGQRLHDSVEDCISREVRRFYVVVPMTPVEHETTSWSGGFGLGVAGTLGEEGGSPERMRAALEENARRQEAELDDSRRRAQHRLELMIERIESMDGEAEGEVGVDDPLEATKTVLGREASFDEIIVSTLPARLSRWLKMDLPSRIARLTDVPVTTIEAKAETSA